jgi:transposase
MRGNDAVAGSLFSYVDVEKRVRADHPLRVIRGIVNATLSAMSAEFDALYSPVGRESIPPERLLRALLLQAFYTIRSERQLVERIEFDLLFRWFVGLGVDDPVWDATTFTKNRDRLLEGDIANRFLAAVLAQPQVKALLSTEHFSVDGTLLEAWASTKCFRPKDGSSPPADPGRNGEQDFRGQKRRNDTHASTTDPDARLYRKGRGKEAKLCFMGHALMENRNGLIVGAVATRASGHAERLAARHLIEPHAGRAQRVTVGADKAFDTQDCVDDLRESTVSPHVARNDNGRRSAIDRRTAAARVLRHMRGNPHRA